MPTNYHERREHNGKYTRVKPASRLIRFLFDVYTGDDGERGYGDYNIMQLQSKIAPEILTRVTC